MTRLLAVLLFVISAGVFAGEKTDSKLPLQADKTLEFQVNEATWLSIDVAPDGRQIVMEVLGDLYLLPIEGGAAQPLTQGMYFDSQPRFSPDGKQIVFVSDRSGEEGVWLLELASGDARRLTGPGDRFDYASPTWSPDGQQIMVSRSTWELRTFELWAYSLEGGSGVRITQAKAKADTPKASRHNALGAVFDSTGRYLYYARKLGGFGYNRKFPMWQIARRDLQGAREDILTRAPGSAIRPQLSPDGRYLVYGTRHEQQTGLRIRTLDSGHDEWLAYPVQRDEQESRYTRDLLPGYAFTPDGQSLILTKNGKLMRLSLTDKRMMEIPFTVNVVKDIASRLDFSYRTGLGPVKARILSGAVLSPDKSQLAFSAFSRIYLHTFASSKTVAVSPEGLVASSPAWSPRGNALAYVSWRSDGGHIYRSRARANAKAKQLTRRRAYYLSPTFSPDGKRIVALRGSAPDRLARLSSTRPGSGSDVIWIEAKGSEEQLVVPSAGFGRPHFGPEPDRIYLQKASAPNPGSSRSGLVSVRYDGSDRRDVLFVSGPGIYNQGTDVGAEAMRISPDGRYVLFKHHSQLYITPLLAFLPGQQVKLEKPQLPLFQLTDVGADHLGWSASGDAVYWSVGNRLYQRSVESFEFEHPNDVANGNKDKDSTETQPSSTEEQDEYREAHEAATYHDVDLYLPRHRPSGTIAFTNAVILTMGSQGTIERGTLVVESDRITAVGASDEIEIPQSATVFDLGGRVISPGFIDTHAHYNVTRGVPSASSASLLANLAYGVTTGMDVQPATVDALVVQDMVDAGIMLGPRTFSTGPGVLNNNAFKSKQHALAVLKRYKDFYKVNNVKAYLTGSRQQRQWVIQAARELNLMPTTEGALDMKLDLSHVIDGFSGLEHNFPLPTLYDDVVQLAARTRIAYTPTLLVTYGGPSAENYYYSYESPHNDAKLRRFMPYSALAARTLRRSWMHESEYVFPQVAKSTKAIVDAGGQVGIGAHGQLQGLGYHWELWSVASGGYSNAQALRLATIMGAQMLGLSDDLGSLEVGKLADVLVFDADPRDDLRNTTALQYVMKGGDLYDAHSLDQIWPEAKTLPQQWWWHNGPESLKAVTP